MGFKPGLPELLIVLLLVVFLFGVGRISKVAGELGNGIRSFRKGLKGEEGEKSAEEESGDKKES
jgi:sec-independent protein translocase protein TatA